MLVDLTIYKPENIISQFVSGTTSYVVYGAVTINNITGYPFLVIAPSATISQGFIPETIRVNGADGLSVSSVNLKTDFADTISILQHIIPQTETAFIIDKSFEFDGVNEHFRIPNTDLNATLEGTNKAFTMSFMFKRGASGVTMKFSNNVLEFQFTDASIECTVLSPTPGALQANYDSSSLADWHFVTVVIDTANSANNRLYGNAVSQTLVTNTIGTTIGTSAEVYSLGRHWNGTLFFNGNISHTSLVNRVLSQEEVSDLYNGGAPKNPQELFEVDCTWFFNKIVSIILTVFIYIVTFKGLFFSFFNQITMTD